MRPFTIDDLLRVNQFAHRCPWDLSPDGVLLAVTLSEARRRQPLHEDSLARTIHGVGLEANGAHLLVIDTTAGEVIAPFEASTSWAGRWSPDGQTLAAYVAAPPPRACIGLWDRKTRSVRLIEDAVIKDTLPFHVPQWTPDGLRVVVNIADDAGTAGTSEESDVIVRRYDPTDSAADQNDPFYKRRDRGM